MATTINLQIPKEIIQIANTIFESSETAYLTGGCVRDLLRGVKPTDWDLTTSAIPEKLQSLFPHSVLENDYGTVSVVLDECEIPELKVVEITPFRKESTYSNKRHPDKVSFGVSLEEDLARRDFTINALAYDIKTKELTDLHGGVLDLNNKTIRCVGDAEDRFAEDALRLMRAVRLTTTLAFKIEDTTYKAIKTQNKNLQHIAAERVRDELVKIISSPNPMRGIELLKETNLLEHILPELLLGVKIEQNQAHSYSVYEHNLRTLQHSADKDLSLILRLAAMLHDSGKPHCREWSEKNKDWSFHQHDLVGSRLANKILKRLKFSNELTSEVTLYVRWHMFFSDTEQITLSGVRRMIARVGEGRIWKLIDLRMCDRIGTGRPKENPYRLRKYTALIERVLKEPISPGDIALNGVEIMKITNLQPGPKVGQIINTLVAYTIDDPSLNTKEILTQKAQELNALPPEDLKKISKDSRLRLSEEEDSITKKIFDKYNVKEN